MYRLELKSGPNIRRRPHTTVVIENLLLTLIRPGKYRRLHQRTLISEVTPISLTVILKGRPAPLHWLAVTLLHARVRTPSVPES